VARTECVQPQRLIGDPMCMLVRTRTETRGNLDQGARMPATIPPRSRTFCHAVRRLHARWGTAAAARLRGRTAGERAATIPPGTAGRARGVRTAAPARAAAAILLHTAGPEHQGLQQVRPVLILKSCFPICEAKSSSRWACRWPGLSLSTTLVLWHRRGRV